CEDIWYPMGPVSYQSHGEAEVIININASPFYAGKRQLREKMLATRAYDNSVILAYTNLVGGQDELVFDGASVIFDQTGEVITRGKQFEEDLVVADLDVEAVFRSRLHDPRRRKEKFLSQGLEAEVESQVISQAELLPPKPPLSSQEVRVYADVVAEVYAALVLGTKDYVHKNGFRKVVIGLSGGVDSSLTAVIAVDALGPENVIGVSMPSQYSSRGSRTDAQVLAKNLGIRLITVPIARTHATYLRILQDAFQGTQPDVTEENLQARIRGNILMALSNKFGWLVLATGNKSEMATGYSTLYGDMAGGFAVIKDVTKTLVYQLAHYRNYLSLHPIIPHSVIVKEPSAELRPNQRDVDTLPPYPVLDPILQAYVEDDRTFPEMIEMGFDEAVVKRVISMVDRSEYKRRQAPPGIKITPRAFGKDRRLPIVNRYRSF
ncbi:MAG: NAD+ synthase, partial [Chloroflexi bacterium]|nr:NAD+ synthase [Chloroflexota bacterium]